MIQKINVKNTLSVLLSSFLFFGLFLFPLIAIGQSSTPGTGIAYECNSGGVIGNCSYADLISAVKRVINWLILFTLQFSVVVIAWAGFNFMTSGDSASKRTEAKEMLRKVAVGIFWVLAAWVVVNLIANTLLTQAVKGVVPIGATP